MANEKEPSFKKGFTVHELEGNFKKHGFEITLTAIFALTAIFSLLWSGWVVTWSILLCMIFAIVGIFIPQSMHKSLGKAVRLIYKEDVSAVIAAVVGLLVAIFLPLLIFAVVGLIAGKTLSRKNMMEASHHMDAHHHEKAQGE